ncbi:MAG: hypothetical protein KatS3mg008_1321 [Acidimicrobiales bacterium]|nr:MAG: hypothetical protein KatS3mg008_1321 [Acidimicrobiales bacterium]
MAHEHLSAPDPETFEPVPADKAELWSKFGRWDRVYFPRLVGLVVEEVRFGYCRMRLPYRSELDQPTGVVHGGAIATLLDTVVVPAIAVAYDTPPVMLTLSLNVDFLGALKGRDAVGEGWVTRRGRSIVFCEALVRDDGGSPVAKASLVYKVSHRTPPTSG